jgi:membrane protease YdiL (CAAX protease family)
MSHLRRTKLWVEFIVLFVAGPIVAAVFLPPTAIFAMLFALTALGIVLLVLTRDFQWSELWEGWRFIDPILVAGFCIATASTAYFVARITAPEALFSLVLTQPLLMLAIIVLYPLVSALPQELVYRPLFFRRYGRILPDNMPVQIVLNAGLFSLAHLMYWSPTVLAMTFIGGLIFAFAYETRGNFPEALVLHSLSGIIVFAIGLGAIFYSGNVIRPF